MPDSLDQIVESSEAERLATGFEFTEGPLWHPEGYLLFVNNRINVIYRLVPGGDPEVIRDNSGAANGLTFDLQGRLIMCEGDNRQITRWEPDGSITVIADRWEGKAVYTGPTTWFAAPTEASTSPAPAFACPRKSGKSTSTASTVLLPTAR